MITITTEKSMHMHFVGSHKVSGGDSAGSVCMSRRVPSEVRFFK